MAKKKQETDKKKKIDTSGVVGLVGSTTEQPVTETLEVNYMPQQLRQLAHQDGIAAGCHTVRKQGLGLHDSVFLL